SSVAPGELWMMGEHRLLCGDATSSDDLRKVTPSSSADLLWTDPPYGVAYVGKTRHALTLSNDDASGVSGLLEEAFEAIDRVLRPGSPLYVAHPAGPLSVTFALRFLGVGWRRHQSLV